MATVTFRVNHGSPSTSGASSVVADHNGRVLHLRTEAQMFNPYQRRAIAVRGGGCISRGCYSSVRWC